MKRDYRAADDMLDEPEALRKLNVESLIEAKEIGATIKRMRLKRSMGLVDLGAKAGLSASFLSQLETGRVVPTIHNLARIALVFKADLSIFFRQKTANRFDKSRNGDRVRLPVGEKGAPFMYAESMSSLIPDRSIVPCIAELLPDKGDEAFEARLHPGAEFVFVLEGAVNVSTDQRSETLERHDIAWLEAGAKRAYQCAGSTPARVMIISFPAQT